MNLHKTQLHLVAPFVTRLRGKWQILMGISNQNLELLNTERVFFILGFVLLKQFAKSVTVRCQFHQHYTCAFLCMSLFGSFFLVTCTVKLGYNDHGYSEYTVIMNKMRSLVWLSIIYAYNFMLIANKNLVNHSYNEQNFNFMSNFKIKSLIFNVFVMFFIIFLEKIQKWFY